MTHTYIHTYIHILYLCSKFHDHKGSRDCLEGQQKHGRHQQENVKDTVQVILTEEEIPGASGFVGILK